MKKIFLIFVFVFFALNVFSENSPVSSNEDYMIEHFEQALDSAKKTKTVYLNELETEKNAYEELKKQVNDQIERLNIYKNLLIVPDVSISALEKSLDEINVGLSTLKSRISGLNSRLGKTDEKLASVEDKINFSSKILGKAAENNGYMDEIKNYKSILEDQKKLLISIKNHINSKIELTQSLISSLEDLKLIFEKDIREKKEVILFENEDISLEIFSFNVIRQDLARILEIVSLYVSYETFLKKKELLKEHINTGHFVAVFVFAVCAVSFFSIKRYLVKNEKYQNLKTFEWGYPIILVEKSIFLFLLLFLTEVFIRSKLYIVFPDILKFSRNFILVLLFTKIASESLRLIAVERDALYIESIFSWRNRLSWGIRGYAFVYLALESFASFENTILLALRVVFEILLCIVVFIFWSMCKKSEKYRENNLSRLIEWWVKGVFISGLLFELAGFRYLTSWWFVSWGKTAVLICLVFILYHGLDSLKNYIYQKKSTENEAEEGRKSYYWFFSNGAYFFIICIFITGFAFSWGRGEVFLSWFFDFFSRKYAIGKIELSIAGFVYAALVILITYVFTSFWKKIMGEYFLKESGLSEGVKDSITTVSVYLVWAAGILISFSVLGLNSASMAFGFGALGIGLGFGLQNIFSNFISGLILLFERPIQVGDVVEVGGVWGEVIKINVRATIVQTYTHSSLIIPNSEFISSQVINWSHRDPFIRRDLNVGVSYSSDTALVEKLLLQAADKVPEIRLYPKKPVVQFINFGDSSLDFRVRFWSTIDDFVNAESKLRFAITNIFRENNIEIPFPQRDIYIKSSASSGDSAGKTLSSDL